jgi:hypothetical protein
MVALVFIYYIGKAFYDLALRHDKNNAWAYAILGVFSYYATLILGACLMVFALTFWSPETLVGMSENSVGLMGIPFGLLGCWGSYHYTQKRWENKYDPIKSVNSNLLDENLD